MKPLALPVLVAAAALLLAGCDSGVQGAPATSVGSQPPSDVAVIDEQATGEVLTALGEAAEAVFSYDSSKPGAHDAAVKSYVRGDAVGQIEALFQAIVEQPGKVVVTTTVAEAAAAKITAAEAEALLYLRQESAQADGGKPSQGVAAVLLTGTRQDGTWRITGLDADPAMDPIRVSGEGPARARDAVSAAAQSAAVTLVTVDSADAEGTYDAHEAVATGGLLDELRGTRETFVSQLRQSGSKARGHPDAATAVADLDVEGGTATALVAPVSTITSGGKTADRLQALVLELTRTGGGWKVGGLRTATAS